MQQNLSPRIERLKSNLKQRAISDRSGEWINRQNLPDVAKQHPNEHVIVRRAYAIDAMLEALCNTHKTGNTHCFELEEGDLLAGTIPMGSNGLGKVFPNYLTPEELRIGSITNKSEMALLGHNSINYEKLLKHGLKDIYPLLRGKAKAKAKGKHRGCLRQECILYLCYHFVQRRNCLRASLCSPCKEKCRQLHRPNAQAGAAGNIAHLQ